MDSSEPHGSSREIKVSDVSDQEPHLISSDPSDKFQGSSENMTASSSSATRAVAPPPKKGLRFWIAIASLSLLGFIAALDVTIIPPALPTIIDSIGGATDYIWIANSFVLASSVLQPLFGQLANIIGRKIPIMASITFFILGSGIAGGAVNPAMLISGRAIQGIGAGGISVLTEIITCDFVPLRERGKYVGIVQAWAGVAAAIGPVVGGALAEKNWRWIFYINIPICALPLLTIGFFIHAHKGSGNMTFRNLDWIGNLIFTPSVTAVLYGLISGGVLYPWSSWRIILSLTLGLVGWIVFHTYQHFAPNPSIPSRLFLNSTSAAGFALDFMSAILLQTAGSFIPIYFQSVLGTSVSTSGVYFIPVTIIILFGAAGSGALLTKLGVYKPLHFAAFALASVGFGLFTLLGPSTSKGIWVVFEIIAAAGLGITASCLLPAILAALPESEVASANAAFSFIRTFGFTWGVTVAAIIFNTVFNAKLSTISDTQLREQLRDGRAFAFASQIHKIRPRISPKVWMEVAQAYTASLKGVWWFGLGAAILGLLFVAFEQKLELSTELVTEYGLYNRNEDKNKVGH